MTTTRIKLDSTAHSLIKPNARTKAASPLVRYAIAIAAILVAFVGCDDELLPPEEDPRFDALREAIENDLAANAATAASVSVWLDGEIIWVGGFGTASPSDAPPDEDTLFMIGSDTKKMTTITYLQRVAAGQASLDTTLSSTVPDLSVVRAPDYVSATAHQLMSNQGGIEDHLGPYTSETTDAYLHDYSVGDFAQNTYPLSPPGTFFNYSNANFSMIALMAETIADRPWADLVEEDVFAPLGMMRSFARKSSVDDNHAAGMGSTDLSNLGGEPPRLISLEDTWDNAFARPAGQVWSTPSDQMRLAEFLADGDDSILPQELHELLHTAHVPLYPDMPTAYGYGLIVTDSLTVDDRYYEGVEVWRHGGATTSHSSKFQMLPEQRFAISILSNGLYDNFDASVNTAIETLVDLPVPSAVPALPFDPNALDAFTGTYHDPNFLGDVFVTRQGDVLHVDIPAFDIIGLPYNKDLQPLTTRVWQITVADSVTQPVWFADGPNGETYFASRGFSAVRPAPETLSRRMRTPAPTRTPKLTRDEVVRRLRHAALTPLP